MSSRSPTPPPADPDAALTAALDGDAAPDDLALRDALVDVAWALVEVAPRAHLRDRLLAAAGGGRLEPFTARLAALFDLGLDRAREVLAWVEDPQRWLPAVPGVALVHVRGGPAVAGADCGLVRVAPGVGFPWHSHHAEEHTLFVAGTCRDHAGVLYQPGDVLVLAAGSAHGFTSVGDGELVLCVRHRGVDFTAPRPPG